MSLFIETPQQEQLRLLREQREQLKHGVVDVYISFSGFDPIHIKLHLVRSFSLSSAFNPVKAVNMEVLVKIHLPVGI